MESTSHYIRHNYKVQQQSLDSLSMTVTWYVSKLQTVD